MIMYATRFFLKHRWGREKAALGFGLDQIRILVSMSTDSSHRVIMGKKLVATLAPLFVIGSSSFLQVARTIITSRMGLNLSHIRLRTAEFAALERLKKKQQGV